MPLIAWHSELNCQAFQLPKAVCNSSLGACRAALSQFPLGYWYCSLSQLPSSTSVNSHEYFGHLIFILTIGNLYIYIDILFSAYPRFSHHASQLGHSKYTTGELLHAWACLWLTQIYNFKDERAITSRNDFWYVQSRFPAHLERYGLEYFHELASFYVLHINIGIEPRTEDVCVSRLSSLVPA